LIDRNSPNIPLRIAVVGTGISGMSAAWLLSQRHDVTVYEQADRIGGHSHTVDVRVGALVTPVDTGFIVFNEVTYPNLVALFRHLDVPTKPSNMSFAVSLDDGAFEYAGGSLGQLFAQKRNLLSPRFWSMLRDVRRFYRDSPAFAETDDTLMSLGDYLDRENYCDAFQTDHLLPMASAIWSAPVGQIRDYPAAAFIRFCENHGLLKIGGRPIWRTVRGGSRTYVKRLTELYADRIKLAHGVRSIRRVDGGVMIEETSGESRRFDRIVVATHADQALALLSDPSPIERELLGAFRYTRNLAVLHSDASLMPRRKSVWSSWNYCGHRDGERQRSPSLSVTYWMNRLQGIPEAAPLFVTLNPVRPPRPDTVINAELYEHPLFDAGAMRAQRRLWHLQGQRNSWFCGAYFGAGFHEDGLQAGLAVAESLGGAKRPWTVARESARIHLEAA
jgi:predicted NAD/FAD-binding protein